VLDAAGIQLGSWDLLVIAISKDSQGTLEQSAGAAAASKGADIKRQKEGES